MSAPHDTTSENLKVQKFIFRYGDKTSSDTVPTIVKIPAMEQEKMIKREKIIKFTNEVVTKGGMKRGKYNKPTKS